MATLLLRGMVLTFGSVAMLKNTAHSRSLAECTFGENQDCDGDDMIKVNGTTTTMTQRACCDLCRQTKGCKVIGSRTAILFKLMNLFKLINLFVCTHGV